MSTDNSKKSKKKSKKPLNSVDPNNKEGEKQQQTRVDIEKLLPVALTDPSNTKSSIDHNVYSLFEACDACRQTKWLKGEDKKKQKEYLYVQSSGWSSHQEDNNKQENQRKRKREIQEKR